MPEWSVIDAEIKGGKKKMKIDDYFLAGFMMVLIFVDELDH